MLTTKIIPIFPVGQQAVCGETSEWKPPIPSSFGGDLWKLAVDRGACGDKAE
ncbi:hypothetical protein CULCOIPH001_02930 [Corynebacterium ulcerans]|nr:hypothetical protein CULCOIPH001_02930 [Corynebacterium ulcerans]